MGGIYEILLSIWPMMEYAMIFGHDPINAVKLMNPCCVISEIIVD